MSLFADAVVHAWFVALVVGLFLASSAFSKFMVKADAVGPSAPCRFGPVHFESRSPASSAIALSAILLVFAVGAAAATMPDGVLIIHSNQRPTPAAMVIEDTLRKVVPDALGRPVEFFSEYLDVERSSAEAYAAAEAEFLRQKYGGRNIRVIVAAAPQALQFATEFRDRMLAGVSIVHVSVAEDELKRLALPPDIVGETVNFDPMATLELALRLQPEAKRLLIVTGAAERDRIWEQRLRGAVERLQHRLEVEYLSALPTADVLHRLGALTKDTIVYTPGFFVDGTGHVGTPRQSLELIAPASGAPVYGPLDTLLGTGIVGGYMAPYQDQANEAGAIVVRLLNGAAPIEIAPSSVRNVPIVDWRQIRRWGFDERLLPPDTIVRFRESNAWDRYWREITVGLAILVLQAGLIAALLLERRLRRRTATALEESQEQMNLAARAASLSMWIWDVARDKVWTTAQWRQPAGLPKEQPIAFNDVLAAAHPADREELDRAVRKVLTSGEELDFEYRVVGPDGEVRWIAARGRAEARDGPRLLGIALDITERKLSELRAEQDRSALRHMTRVSMVGQLSAAIAHQLNQPLAAILGNAEAAQKMLEREKVDLVELREICNDIVTEDHRASEVIRRLRELYTRGDMAIEPLDLNELIRDTLDLVRTELLTRYVTPVTELAPAMPAIKGGRVQLQQVLLNLVLNAADAMNSTDVTDRTLTIRTELTGAEIRLYVVDHGTGIAVGDLKSVFDAFWSTKERGMGVGLAICESIVAAHRGSIMVANNADGGATFCVSLPVGEHT
jgi:signal transduction histidine kinase